jgi:aspartate/methionine/tyrosine aminotransferase
MQYRRLPIEIESPEERGYETIRCNLTESSFTDGTLAEFGVELSGDLPVAYGDHRGLPELRELIAEHSNPGGISTLGSDDVVCTPGAAAALFFIATSLLEPGDHLLVEHTNYATNIETPRVIGAEVEPLELHLDDGFRLDIDRVARSIRQNTKLVSVTSPHNPTGTVLTRDQLDALVEMAERHDLWLLVDETYRDMDPNPLPVAATLSPRAISVSSMSKSMGCPVFAWAGR